MRPTGLRHGDAEEAYRRSADEKLDRKFVALQHFCPTLNTLRTQVHTHTQEVHMRSGEGTAVPVSYQKHVEKLETECEQMNKNSSSFNLSAVLVLLAGYGVLRQGGTCVRRVLGRTGDQARELLSCERRPDIGANCAR